MARLAEKGRAALAAVVLFVATAAGLMGYLELAPDVRVEADAPFDPAKASTMFTVTNEGRFALHDVRAYCVAPGVIDLGLGAKVAYPMLGSSAWDSSTLERHEKQGVSCGASMPLGYTGSTPPQALADVVVLVDYKSFLLPHRLCRRWSVVFASEQYRWIPRAAGDVCDGCGAAVDSFTNRDPKRLLKYLPGAH